MKKISVCIPCYESAHLIKRAIDSILRQTYSNFEIIIVDNCSRDNIEQVIQEYQSNKIQFYKNNTNIGYPANVNKCLSLATGDYITIVCADDFLISNDVFSKWIEIMEKGDFVAVHSPFSIYRFENGVMRRGQTFSPLQEGINSPQMILNSFLKGKGAFGWGWMFKKSLVNVNGIKFQTDHNMSPDTMFFLQISLLGNVFETERSEPMYGFVMHEASLGVNLFENHYQKIYKQLILFENRFFSIVENQYPSYYHTFKKYKYRYTVNEYIGLLKNNFIIGNISRAEALLYTMRLLINHKFTCINYRFILNSIFILMPRTLGIWILKIFNRM